MACGFTEYELFIIWRICRRNRWCNKHIGRQDLVGGRPGDRIGEYKRAIDSLVTKGFLLTYHAQGRDDVCMPKPHRARALEVLKAHEKECPFIKYLEFIR